MSCFGCCRTFSALRQHAFQGSSLCDNILSKNTLPHTVLAHLNWYTTTVLAAPRYHVAVEYLGAGCFGGKFVGTLVLLLRGVCIVVRWRGGKGNKRILKRTTLLMWINVFGVVESRVRRDSSVVVISRQETNCSVPDGHSVARLILDTRLTSRGKFSPILFIIV